MGAFSAVMPEAGKTKSKASRGSSQGGTKSSSPTSTVKRDPRGKPRIPSMNELQRQIHEKRIAEWLESDAESWAIVFGDGQEQSRPIASRWAEVSADQDSPTNSVGRTSPWKCLKCHCSIVHKLFSRS
mmetsp:Transcript_121204/g.354272  ORF Transcript_121204/g.354272 Transcript_121204/m.354272 type:complete len:128 (-) Transcript_121204:100-483(-)